MRVDPPLRFLQISVICANQASSNQICFSDDDGNGDDLTHCHVERRAAQATGVLEEGSRRQRASSPMRQEPEESVQAKCTQGGVERGDKNEETSRECLLVTTQL
jgi:hypothetical protein